MGAERFCLEPPSAALPLTVHILAPQPTLRRYPDSVEGKQAVRALTIAMNASWRGHPDPAMAARMTDQAMDLQAALYGEQGHIPGYVDNLIRRLEELLVRTFGIDLPTRHE